MGSSDRARLRRGRTRARVAVGLGVIVLLVSALTPIASASPSAKGSAFGSATAVRKQVGKVTHASSMAAVAAEAARHPRTDRGPALKIPTLRFGMPAAARPPTAFAKPARSSTIRPAIVSLPDVQAPTQFAGLTEAESGLVIPADPWVAVNSSYVVQIVNLAVRVSTRSGATLFSIPNEAFFGVEPGHNSSDPRIIWDAAHGRWVGEVVYYTDDLLDDGLVLAISDGADPTLGWTLIPILFGDALPDYPSLASSSDKIVITDNLFDSSFAFLGADFNTIRWSEVLNGGTILDHGCSSGNFMHPRAAQVLSSSNDVHLVMEATDGSSDQIYFRLTGAGDCPGNFVDGTDLTTDLSFAPLRVTGPTNGLPPPPRQVGSDTIGTTVMPAFDERYTDAVWQGNHLYWVSTYPVTYDAGATWNDQVIVWSTNTASVSGPPTGANLTQIQPGDTIDAYMGGIGLTRSGIPIVTYSQSSSTDPIALYANRIDAGSLGTPLLLDTSDAAIDGERWGDYAGVAMDPSGTGSAWVTHMLAGPDGSWRTEVARIVVDNDLPSTPGAPAATTVSPTPLGFLPKYRLSWGGASDGATGAVSYRLEQSIDGGGFAYVGTLGGNATYRSLSLSHSYRYRVAAVDAVGNVGSFAIGPTIHASLAQAPTSKTGTWHTQASGNFLGGGTWYASAAGASASYKTTGLRSIAIVTTKASSRGSFKVYIDGALKATINCHTTATSYRQVAYQFTWSTPGTHTIKIVVLGTAGHPRVDFDGVLLLK
jgi:hypothetical protein